MPSEFVRDLRLCHPPHGFEQTTAHVNAKWLMSVADHLEKTESKLQAAEGALAREGAERERTWNKLKLANEALAGERARVVRMNDDLSQCDEALARVRNLRGQVAQHINEPGMKSILRERVYKALCSCLAPAPAPERSARLSRLGQAAKQLEQSAPFAEPAPGLDDLPREDLVILVEELREANNAQAARLRELLSAHPPPARSPSPDGPFSDIDPENIIIKDPDRTLVVADDKGTVLPLRVWALKGSPSHDAVANVIGEMRSVAALIKVRGQGSVGAMGIERWATELAAAVGEVKP